ncbi:MAG: polysaccharide deacetylase family protein [Aeriscardovia sp.]|nr:polysaccharide deacetylase family protein [Aeriscardovia sp.]
MQSLYKYLNALAMRFDNFQIQKKRNVSSFIAMFHDVIHNDKGSQYDAFSIYEKDLMSFVDSCSEKGYEFIPLELFFQERETECKKCAITFDDGYESLFTIAAPFLIKQNIPFTVFVTTSYLDKPGYLTSEMIKELSQIKLCTIAMHAHNHLMFRYETDQTLKDNFIECKNRLIELTGLEPDFFAFPYGSVYACSKHNCKVVKEMGAKAVFVTRQRMLTKSDLRKRLYIPRLNIPGYYNNTIAVKNRGIEV